MREYQIADEQWLYWDISTVDGIFIQPSISHSPAMYTTVTLYRRKMDPVSIEWNSEYSESLDEFLGDFKRAKAERG